MMRLVCALLLLAPMLWAQGASDFVTIPPQPVGRVHDPGNLLDRDLRLELGAKADRYFEASKTDIWFAIYEKSPPQGGRIFARSLINEWRMGDNSVVILHVPGDPDSPYAALVGNVVDQRPSGEEWAEIQMIEAMSNARARTGVRKVLNWAANEVNVVIQFHVNNGKVRDALFERRNAETWQRNRRRHFLFLGVAAASFVFIAAVVTWLFLRSRRKSVAGREVFFPNVAVQQRYLAPYSGGEGIVRDARIRR